MPRYFFDTDNGSDPCVDLVGRDLPDDAAARWFGLDTLPDMARDNIAVGDHRTFGVVISNAERVVIYSATIALMGGWKNGHEQPSKPKLVPVPGGVIATAEGGRLAITPTRALGE